MSTSPRVLLVTGPLSEPAREITLDRSMTITEVIEQHKLAFRLPTIAVVARDGEAVPIMRGSWDVRMVGAGDVLAFVAIPGGQRGSGKNILGLVASIALAVVAPVVGGAVAGALGLGAIGQGIASVAFLAGGTLNLSASLPKGPSS